MRVAVETDPGKRLGERSAGEFLMRGESAILCNSVGESESVQLDIGVAVYEALLDGCDAIPSAVGLRMKRVETLSDQSLAEAERRMLGYLRRLSSGGDLVTNLEVELPVFRSELFRSCLEDDVLKRILGSEHLASLSPGRKWTVGKCLPDENAAQKSRGVDCMVEVSTERVSRCV